MTETPYILVAKSIISKIKYGRRLSINDRLKYIYDIDSFTYKDYSLSIYLKILLDILLEYHLVEHY